ncbi:hypothetical protein CYMTET_13290 [Cymbomonas tetramitiformis]|uniref:Uncharacterized protein n=1 Tax=Cymbomonas tetramitiformis TaxID=36881 RepID=A0AAE0LB80_9CHLO|nr:hypothetical protein CYMTET_13290 [Cymbomonas tetramitiformis]
MGPPQRPNVWTPSGGWYPDPVGWRRNTGVAFIGLFALCGMVFYKSAENEYRVQAPAFSIPSMMWGKSTFLRLSCHVHVHRLLGQHSGAVFPSAFSNDFMQSASLFCF